MEVGANGHPGLLAVQIVEKGLKQEEESAINHPPLMEGLTVKELLMKQKDVTQKTVQLMEDGAFGHPGHLAMLNVVEEL